MIQSYQPDPVLHNYLAPAYPIFIQIKYLISSLNIKKSLKNSKADITQVSYIQLSLPRVWVQKENALLYQPSSNISRFGN